MQTPRLKAAITVVSGLLIFLPATSSAQRPSTTPKSRPTARPSNKPSDAAKRRQIRDRKNPAPSRTPSSGNRPGSSPGPKPKPPARVKDPVAARRATRLLGQAVASERRLRDETWHGHATLIDRLGTRRSITVRSTTAWRDGTRRCLIQHGRGDDLPDVAHLFELGKGRVSGWTLKPEERTVTEGTPLRKRYGRSGLMLADLVGHDLGSHRLEYDGSTIVESRPGTRFLGAPTSPRPHARARFELQDARRFVGRVTLFLDGEKPWREIRYTDFEMVGVFRRWKSAVIRDFDRGATVLLSVKGRRVNSGVSFDGLVPSRIREFMRR